MKKNRAGFTLLEVLIAVVVLGLAYVAVLESFSTSLRNISRLRVTRTQTFSSMIQLEELIRETDIDDDIKVGKKKSYKRPDNVWVEGNGFVLEKLVSEDTMFTTLKLAQKK